MSRLGLIAAIPGKGLTNGLLLRRAAVCVTVTREDECLTSNKNVILFFFLRRYANHASARERYACDGHISARGNIPREKMNSELYSGKLTDSEINAACVAV